MGGWGWVAGLSETKTKLNPKLKLELKFGAELCNCDIIVVVVEEAMAQIFSSVLGTGFMECANQTCKRKEHQNLCRLTK